jgi:uncharacterized membrane protein
MNNPAVRNGLILIVAVVIAIIVLGFLTTLLSAIVPIAITAIIAFILGRLSVHFNLMNFIRSARAAKPAEAAAPVKAVETPAKTTVAAEISKPAPTRQVAESAAERLADEPKKDSILLDPDFEVKTPEQIEAEARKREQEAMKKATSGSEDAIQAALEERRKRLLGGKE